MQCDVEGCDNEATVALAFRGMYGHSHVCALDERIDREWTDVVKGAPITPHGECPWFCTPPLYVAEPTPL